MKIKSFGCSFTYGSDLHDCIDEPSNLTWPALIAKQKNLDYECYAQPGIGNLQIMKFVLEQARLDDPAFFIINWTWLDRFDYLHPIHETFLTLRPDGTQKEHQLYYQYFYNQYHTMLTNASYVLATIQTLKIQGIDFLMTAQDPILIEPIDPNWQDPCAIRIMQKNLKPYIHWFEGMSFLEWSRKNSFKESEKWHPLEDAHKAAADYMLNFFDKQKTIDPAQQVLF